MKKNGKVSEQHFILSLIANRAQKGGSLLEMGWTQMRSLNSKLIYLCKLKFISTGWSQLRNKTREKTIQLFSHTK